MRGGMRHTGPPVGLDLPAPGGPGARGAGDAALPSYSQLQLTDFHSSTLSLVALEQQTRVGNDLVPGLPKNESFDALVREQLLRLKEILRQLPGESLASLGDLYFSPGGIIDALRALIEEKMRQLARQHESQGGSGEVCRNFVRGVCTLGATCDSSHTDAALRRWVADWVPLHVRDGALCITESLGREALAYVLQYLETSSGVHTLRVHALEKHSVKVVCKKVSVSAAPHLSVLDLSYTFGSGSLPLGRVHPEGTARLAAALAQNNTVEQLYIDNNELGSKGFLTLLRAFDRPHGNNTLRVLSAKHNGIDGEDTPLRLEAAADILLQTTSLEQLSLACNPLHARGAAALAPVLRGNQHLCILDLCGTQIGDEGAKAVADALREAPAAAADGPCGLLSLNIGWCRIGPLGLGYLFDALGERPGSLTELSVYCNTCNSKTGSARIGDLLKQNNTLTALDLRWTYPSDESANSILDEVSKSSHSLRSLDMTHNDLVTDRRVLDLIAKKIPPACAGGPATRLRQKRIEIGDFVSRAHQRVKEREEQARREALGSTPQAGQGSPTQSQTDSSNCPAST